MAELSFRHPPLLESGVLAYRLDRRGTIRVLVVTTKSGRWGIPKGRVEPHLSFADNAAKEAFEEAGIRGEVAPVAAGMYRAIKRTAAGEIVIEVWVYPMRVTEILEDFPERGRRAAKWVTVDEAARLLREPFLAKQCLELAARTPSIA